MSEVKIHTVNSEDLSPRIVGEGFCTDVVRYSDYAAMEAKCAALAAENATLKEDYRTTPALRSKGWPKSPATDAFIAEQRAQGVEIYADSNYCSEDNRAGAFEFADKLRQEGAQ